MGFFAKLILNQANRLDPKYIIIYGKRDEYKEVNFYRVKFKKLDKLGIKYEKFNSYMMVNKASRELKAENKVHFTVERW